MHHISNTIPPCDILPTSFSPLRPHQGVAGSCLWEGRQDGLSHLAASTWTAHLHPHPPSHHLRHHPPLHLLLQGLWQGQLFEYARSICETLQESFQMALKLKEVEGEVVVEVVGGEVGKEGGRPG